MGINVELRTDLPHHLHQLVSHLVIDFISSIKHFKSNDQGEFNMQTHVENGSVCNAI